MDSVIVEANDEVVTDKDEWNEIDDKGSTHVKAFDAFETTIA